MFEHFWESTSHKKFTSLVANLYWNIILIDQFFVFPTVFVKFLKKMLCTGKWRWFKTDLLFLQIASKQKLIPMLNWILLYTRLNQVKGHIGICEQKKSVMHLYFLSLRASSLGGGGGRGKEERACNDVSGIWMPPPILPAAPCCPSCQNLANQRKPETIANVNKHVKGTMLSDTLWKMGILGDKN